MELKFVLWFRVIREYLSQIDSIFSVNLTLNIRSIYSQYQVNLILNIESIWLSISSQFDSQYRVNLTLSIELIWLSISSQFDSNIPQLLWIPGRILVLPVTQLFRSKWLHFVFQCCIEEVKSHRHASNVCWGTK